MINKSSVRRARFPRERFHFVIAGLDPAIHADAPLARIDRTDRVRRIYGFHKTRA